MFPVPVPYSHKTPLREFVDPCSCSLNPYGKTHRWLGLVWATPLADFAVITARLWSTWTAIFVCRALNCSLPGIVDCWQPQKDLRLKFECIVLNVFELSVLSSLNIDFLCLRIVQSWFASIPSAERSIFKTILFWRSCDYLHHKGKIDVMMIAFITFNSSLVPLIQDICRSNPWEFVFSGFRWNRTDDLEYRDNNNKFVNNVNNNNKNDYREIWITTSRAEFVDTVHICADRFLIWRHFDD